MKCAECDQSFHIQCQNITRTRFKQIQELNEDEIADRIQWRCDKCRVIKKEFGKIVKQMDELENRTKDMVERVRIDLTEPMILWKTEILKEISAERNNMETKLTEEVTKTLEVERKNVEKTIEDRKINQSSKDVEEILNNRLKEEEEKKKGSKNLLIFGVEESAGVASTESESNQKDKEAINKIMNLLKINENLTITRLGKKKENSIRPLLVTAKDERTKWHIISKGKIVLLCESKLNHTIGNKGFPNNFQIIRPDRVRKEESGRGGGLCILVNNSLTATVQEDMNRYESERIEHLWCKISTKSEQNMVTLGLIYKPPNTSEEDEEHLNKLLKLAEDQKKDQLLIAGDFNYPKIDWNTYESCENNSQIFLDTIQDLFWYQNIKEDTRIRINNEPSLLDLIFPRTKMEIDEITY